MQTLSVFLFLNLQTTLCSHVEGDLSNIPVWHFLQEALVGQLAAAHAELDMVRSQAAAAKQCTQQLQVEHDKAFKETHDELVSMRKQLSKVNVSWRRIEQSQNAACMQWQEHW